MQIEDVLLQRGDRYGHFVGVATISQNLKYLINTALQERDKKLPVEQIEALDMICNKLARILNGDNNYVDSWLDIAGYAQLVADRLNGVDH
jgi:hypothetical protein